MPETNDRARQRLSELRFFGDSLNRPECVLATRAGHWYSADWRGGVVHGLPDGSQRLYTGTVDGGHTLKPNGIALRQDGSFLLADLSDSLGGIFEMTRAGQVRPFLQRVDGMDLPPSNFITHDQSGRIWLTVSTRQQPRTLGYRAGCNDGFIVLVDDKGARIVADGLGYTNECVLDSTRSYLYVNETFGRRISRFAIQATGDLGPRETVTEFGEGCFPDGLAFDQQGDLWVTSIVSNRLIRVCRDGSQSIYLEDSDSAFLNKVELAYEDDQLDSTHLGHQPAKVLRNLSSLAFAGADLRSAYLGNLLGSQIAAMPMPVAGLAPVHWLYDD